MRIESIHGEKSLILGDDKTRITITLRGGHTRIKSR